MLPLLDEMGYLVVESVAIKFLSSSTGMCSTPGLEVIRDPAMDRRSAKTDR